MKFKRFFTRFTLVCEQFFSFNNVLSIYYIIFWFLLDIFVLNFFLVLFSVLSCVDESKVGSACSSFLHYANALCPLVIRSTFLRHKLMMVIFDFTQEIEQELLNYKAENEKLSTELQAAVSAKEETVTKYLELEKHARELEEKVRRSN